MGKATGFLEYTRKENTDREIRIRLKDFNEFRAPLDESARRIQGARCMNCGVPLCQSAMKLSGMVTGCPLHNLIPEWNDEIWHENDDLALRRLLKTNNFPEFTGRVCPALCEKACICGMDGEPVTIHDNELFVIEKAFAEGRMKPVKERIRSGKKVAVVGSGPSGLAVADQLNHRGHEVTVFERDDQIGGLLMYGIPNMKLDKRVIERRRALMESEGVVFRTGADVGRNVGVDEILRAYDAVALCAGAKQARALAAEGMGDFEGVEYAVPFLKSVTSYLKEHAYDASAFEKRGKNPASKVRGKDVVVVGGGDTGNDCVATALRLGAKTVAQIEMMPSPPSERAVSNPWPEWPKILKTDYGQLEAIECFGRDPRIYETTVTKLNGKNGKLRSVCTAKVSFAGGKLQIAEGTEKEIPCGLLLIAAGFTGCEPYTAEAFGTALTSRGVVATEEKRYRTAVEKVFTAGDMHRGQSLVVWAITEGRRCALEIDRYLMGYTDMQR